MPDLALSRLSDIVVRMLDLQENAEDATAEFNEAVIDIQKAYGKILDVVTERNTLLNEATHVIEKLRERERINEANLA